MINLARSGLAGNTLMRSERQKKAADDTTLSPIQPREGLYFSQTGWLAYLMIDISSQQAIFKTS